MTQALELESHPARTITSSLGQSAPDVHSGAKGPSLTISFSPLILQVGKLRPRGESEYLLCVRGFKAATHFLLS